MDDDYVLAGDTPVPNRASRRDISRAFLILSNAAHKIALKFLDDDLPESSRAARYQRDGQTMGPTWRSENGAYGAHVDVGFMMMSGIDHCLAAATLLRSARSLGPSFTSVLRGAVEAFSRVHWLLNAGDARDLVARHSSLVLSDSRYLENIDPNYVYGRSGGENKTVSEMRREIATTRAGLRDTKSAPSRSILVKDLMEAAKAGRVADTGAPGAEYTQMSAVAHGEPLALGAYAHPTHDEAGAVTDVHLETREILMGLESLYTLNALTLVVAEAVAYLEVADSDVERWNAAQESAQTFLDVGFEKFATPAGGETPRSESTEDSGR